MEGRAGTEGRVGLAGETGKTGPTGVKGAPVLSRMQTLTMFLFIVSAFILIAWRSEVNADRISNNSRAIFKPVTVTFAASQSLPDYYC